MAHKHLKLCATCKRALADHSKRELETCHPRLRIKPEWRDRDRGQRRLREL